LPVHLPPGGRNRIDALATAISERAGFFDDAYAIREYDPSQPLQIGPLTITFSRGRHYVPAWGLSIVGPDGARLVYTGDTGPSESVVDFACGADLLLVEAALRHASQDDVERGHLTAEEAIDLATRARARSARIVHYPPSRRPELEALCNAVGSWIRPAVPGLSMTVTRAEPQEIVRTG
jgi:ribonuclease BN (tRNA processing enzyme)